MLRASPFSFFIKSLGRRVTVLTLLPVTVFLATAGFLGFLSAKEVMLAEWREGAIARLQRAAHHINMRLNRPMEWIEMFHTTSGERGSPLIQEWIIKQLGKLEGVEEVQVDWSVSPETENETRGPGRMWSRGQGHAGMGGDESRRFNKGRISEVTAPRYDAQKGKETVSLLSELKDESGKVLGHLTVSIRFDYLMQDIISLGWWQSDTACLVDSDGNYLAHTAPFMTGRSRLGESGNDLELQILKEMKLNPFGTVLGPGHPPDEVAGFYRIELAPWSIVLIAPGEKILGPIIRYRAYYLAAAAACIFMVIVLVRFDTLRIIRSVIAISRAAEKVSRGDYGPPLEVKSADEIGELTKSFNAMVEGLRERDFIANTFGRYMDQGIASELLKRPEASRLGGEKRQVAILMSDIRGFTPLSERLSPEKIINFLNRYFSNIISVVHRHRGIIVDFFGDSILVFFDPFEGPLKPAVQKALQCATEMREGMKMFNKDMMAEDLPELQMGIGVHAGEVVVGNIGSETRAKYGIVGSPVNITQRIQALAGPGEIVISETVYLLTKHEIVITRQFSEVLKGINAEMTMYVLE